MVRCNMVMFVQIIMTISHLLVLDNTLAIVDISKDRISVTDVFLNKVTLLEGSLGL